MKLKIHYAWIIVLVIFINLLAVQGVRLSFGAFIEPWENDFQLDRGTISLISTISFIVYGVSQPFIGTLVDKFGPRLILSLSTILVAISFLLMAFVNDFWQLLVIYGLFVSIGVGGASNVAATVIVTNWFNKKRGLALAIVETGFGAGQMLLVPGSLALIHWIGWKGTVSVLGLILAIVIFPIVLFLIRNNPEDKELEPIGGHLNKEVTNIKKKKSNTFSNWEVYRKKQFWFIILPFAICGFTTTGLMDTHLIPIAQLCGFSTSITGIAVSVLAAFNIIGILISGVIADRWSSRKFLIILFIIRPLSLLILLDNSNPYLFIIFAMIFGLVDFATVAPTQLLATQHFKNYSIGFIIGWLFLSHQIGSALGAYVPGLMYNLHANYNSSFYLSIIILLIGATFTFLLPEQKTLEEKVRSTTQ